MDGRLGGFTVVLGATVVLALSGGIAAWADWDTPSRPGAAKVTSARIPAPQRPNAELSDGYPRIVWDAVTVGGVPVDKYVVIRSGGGARTVVCTVDAPDTGCRDRKASPGSTFRYSVHAALGKHWVGKSSEPSETVVVPATKLIREVTPDAKPAEAAIARTEPVRTPPASPEPAPVTAPVSPAPSPSLASASPGPELAAITGKQ
jgi:hypothetical protein